jgi:hypothetical protein
MSSSHSRTFGFALSARAFASNEKLSLTSRFFEARGNLRPDALVIPLVFCDQLWIILQIKGKTISSVHSASLEATCKIGPAAPTAGRWPRTAK